MCSRKEVHVPLDGSTGILAKSDPLTVTDFSAIRTQESTSVLRRRWNRWRAPTALRRAALVSKLSVPRSAPPARGAELGQCCTQQAVEASVLERRLAQQLLERGAHL